MGQVMMVKRQCVCGAWDEIRLEQKKDPIRCYFVRCPRCGRETAKHIKAEDAIRDWNHMEDHHEPES